MTQLRLRRLTACAAADDVPRVRRLLSGLADTGLDRALAGAALPAGDWCLRRVAVTVPLPGDRSDAALQGQWADALIAALRELIGRAGGDADVVHYPRPADGVADLLAGAATGRTDREWAWRQLGLVAADEPGVATAPRAAAVAVLRRRPEVATAALVGAIQRAGVAALHRLLTASGWADVATTVLAAHRQRDPASLAGTATAAGPPRWSSPEVDRLAEHVMRCSQLASAFRRARIRADAITASAWAALAAAEAEPALPGRPTASAVLSRLAATFHNDPARRHSAGSAASASETHPDPPASPTMDGLCDARRAASPKHSPVSPPPTAEPGWTSAPTSASVSLAAELTPGATTPTEAAPNAADIVEADRTAEPGTPADHWRTPWAGLLFLLATASDAGMPNDLLADAALAGQPLGWTLHHLGHRLVPAAPTDPAVFAFAGAVPSHRPPPPEPDPVHAAALDRHAARWARVTARRLDPTGGDDPESVVAGIAARAGTLHIWPGWVEVHLPLDSVDVDVRRAGLDVDPGWVPWLGTVVVIRYE